MIIKSVTLKNFRGYKDSVHVELNSLTAFVGKNDVGKSTVLEALDIFFNDGSGVIKIDKEDVSKRLGEEEKDDEIVISVEFSDLPENIGIDATQPTTLEEEFLLNENGYLEIVKKYPNAAKAKVFIKARHPTHEICKDLLLKKQNELQKIITDHGIFSDKKTNSLMRAAIRNHFKEKLFLEVIEIDAAKEDAKNIYEKLNNHFPIYSLFQSDRKNSDGDSEVQDPLKLAVTQILKDPDLDQHFNAIANKVRKSLEEVSKKTLEKLNEIEPEIAQSLNPVIPLNESLKWADVFKNVSITGDNDIPINKRGSGVKRLILLSFFRAQAERSKQDKDRNNIIYAIEEPETSQHTENQKIIISSLLALAKNSQIIITTHSANIVKQLEFDNIRLICNLDHTKEIKKVEKKILDYSSLNEVNYQAFNEINEEFHNELYGYIDAEKWITEFKNGKQKRKYIRLLSNGATKDEEIVLSEYIRHQIHHPENDKNTPYTTDELKKSVEEMIDFIESKKNNLQGQRVP